VTRKLKTVAQFSDSGPWTAASLRWMIFQARQNGLATSGALVRLGRRVFIDTDKFDAWLTAQNTPKQQHERAQ
jgi:hypothetical protein